MTFLVSKSTVKEIGKRPIYKLGERFYTLEYDGEKAFKQISDVILHLNIDDSVNQNITYYSDDKILTKEDDISNYVSIGVSNKQINKNS